MNKKFICLIFIISFIISCTSPNNATNTNEDNNIDKTITKKDVIELLSKFKIVSIPIDYNNSLGGFDFGNGVLDDTMDKPTFTVKNINADTYKLPPRYILQSMIRKIEAYHGILTLKLKVKKPTTTLKWLNEKPLSQSTENGILDIEIELADEEYTMPDKYKTIRIIFDVEGRMWGFDDI